MRGALNPSRPKRMESAGGITLKVDSFRPSVLRPLPHSMFKFLLGNANRVELPQDGGRNSFIFPVQVFPEELAAGMKGLFSLFLNLVTPEFHLCNLYTVTDSIIPSITNSLSDYNQWQLLPTTRKLTRSNSQLCDRLQLRSSSSTATVTVKIFGKGPPIVSDSLR